MPPTVAPVEASHPAGSEDALRRLEEALWAAADRLPDRPEAEEPRLATAPCETISG